jgi:hypothetical protein
MFETTPLPMRRIFTTWWPLAASWMLMGVETPLLSAVMARLANPEINLAAYGGVVYPLALIIESPVIMLLAASTALSRDWASYVLIRRFMTIAGAILTALHILVAFTPLYYVVVQNILGVPPEIIEPARLGLMIMIPWTWSIAYRRFNQGVLIRFGYSKSVGIGTVVRLSAEVLVLAMGHLLGNAPGIAVGTAAQAAGVLSEAFFVSQVVKPVLNGPLRAASAVEPALNWQAFWAFYIPLVMTSLVSLLANPIGSAAVSRMPQALISLAVWPVINGFIFMLRSLGIAYNEVVVALLEEARSSPNLLRFANLLAGLTTLALILVAATPLANVWFERISALSPQLAILARNGLWLSMPLPALSVIQSWYQGVILFGRRTRGITESVVIYLIVFVIVQWAGVMRQEYIGLDVALLAIVISTVAQTAWLWFRCRPGLEKIKTRDRSI